MYEQHCALDSFNITTLNKAKQNPDFNLYLKVRFSFYVSLALASGCMVVPLALASGCMIIPLALASGCMIIPLALASGCMIIPLALA